VRHTDSKTNIPAPKDNPYKTQQQNQIDVFYILDVSGLNNKQEQKANVTDEAATILELTKEAQKKFENKALKESERTEAADEEGETPRPDDNTRSLTRALVAAKTRDQVQSVLTDVYDHMREWQGLAATGDKEAIKVVRKLQKLIARGGRKIKDLNEEIVMHQRQQKAEEMQKKQEAKRLELELKEALRERKARERRYLQERDDNNNDDDDEQFGPTIAETEAKIRQLSAQIAALKSGAGDAGVTAVSGVDSAGEISTGVEGGGIEGGDVSGGDASSEE